MCALLHNLFDWYTHDWSPREDQALRLPPIVPRALPVAARVTRHGRTLSLHVAKDAAAVARCVQRQLRHVLRALTRIQIPPVAPAYAPLMYRRV